MVRNARGTFFFFGKDVHFTTQLLFDFPDRFRDVTDVEQDKQKLRIVRVVTRDHAWMSTGGPAAEMNKPEADELREEMYVQWLTTLVAAQGPGVPAHRLAGNESRRPLGGPIKVARAGHGETKALLRQTERTIDQARASGA